MAVKTNRGVLAFVKRKTDCETNIYAKMFWKTNSTYISMTEWRNKQMAEVNKLNKDFKELKLLFKLRELEYIKATITLKTEID